MILLASYQDVAGSSLYAPHAYSQTATLDTDTTSCRGGTPPEENVPYNWLC